MDIPREFLNDNAMGRTVTGTFVTCLLLFIEHHALQADTPATQRLVEIAIDDVGTCTSDKDVKEYFGMACSEYKTSAFSSKVTSIKSIPKDTLVGKFDLPKDIIESLQSGGFLTVRDLETVKPNQLLRPCRTQLTVDKLAEVVAFCIMNGIEMQNIKSYTYQHVADVKNYIDHHILSDYIASYRKVNT